MEALLTFMAYTRGLKPDQPTAKCGVLSAKNIVTFFFIQGHCLLVKLGPARLHLHKRE